jgi:uncharacterized RDD family membrane protein YckC
MVDAVVAPLVQPVMDAVDVDGVVDRIDVEELLARIDLDELLARIDVDALIARIDVDGLVAKVDIDGLVARVDLNQLLDRVDLDRLMGRIDVNALMERVDVNSLMARTELGEVIARSTTGVFGQLVDAVRIAVMSIDLALHGLAARLLRREDPSAQTGPGGVEPRSAVWRLRPQDRAVALQGRYAGAVSRVLAFLLDAALIGAVFGVLSVLTTEALQIIANITWSADEHRLLVGALYVLWQFLYFAGLTASGGRTIGKAVLGIFVVQQDGTPVTSKGAVLRTVAFPVSFLLFGAGFLLGVVRRDRRQLHDLVGGTAVVYAWDAETARLRAGTQPSAA